ncbi:MAG: hypothetical protein J6X33_04780 [Clostridiales bacterium]|nr:hypothetical protein [Clostridiales bacterium]
MKRIISVILVLLMSLTVVSCGEYKVKDEDKALSVYSCSKDNMLGLEKIVIFEDGVAVVMDKETADNSPCGINADEVIKQQKLYISMDLSCSIYTAKSKDLIEVSDGKCIISERISSTEPGGDTP